MKKRGAIARTLLWFASTMFAFFVLLGALIYFHYVHNLPNVDVLNNIKLQTPLRIYSQDSQLIAEYGQKRRVPVRFGQVPERLIQAILATEDQRFFEHPGVDIIGLIRAAKAVIITGSKAEGGSTITMQVARNFFLTRKKTFSRKFNEILLAIKIDARLSKEKILELYINKIYFGNRAYGAAAAANVYYGKRLNELSLAQIAMIAGLPKAPSALNPLANPSAAFKRRNHVLSRMLKAGYIDQATYEQTIKEPLTARYHRMKIDLYAPYVAEAVRLALLAQYGESIYTDGYKVVTTIDSRLQNAATKVVRDGIFDYEKRHGYRGRLDNWGMPGIDKFNEWQEKLKNIRVRAGLQPGAVVDLSSHSAFVLLSNGKIITIPWSGMSWARFKLQKNRLGPKPHHPSDILQSGDVIYVTQHANTWELTQLPDVEAALIAMDPVDGKINAWVGGLDYDESNFDRVNKAKRQVGSNIKPFLYSAALAKGYTLASLINDAPVVKNDPGKNNLWRPENHSHKFYGPTRLRTAMVRSRNLVSVRLLEQMGVEYARDYMTRFGFEPKTLPKTLSLALGTSEFSPLELTAGFAIFANGGYRIQPFVINTIKDAYDRVIYKATPEVACLTCMQQTPVDHQPSQSAETTSGNENQNAPSIASRVIKAQNAYLITSALRDVIQHGTARRAKILKRNDLAGKTGTTNDQRDAWFTGFNSDIVVTTWMGFDQPRSLHEYAAQTALPMWITFMQQALENKPEHTLAQPPGLITMRINPKTGLPANSAQEESIFEIFREEFAPNKATNYDKYDMSQGEPDKGNEVIQEIF